MIALTQYECGCTISPLLLNRWAKAQMGVHKWVSETSATAKAAIRSFARTFTAGRKGVGPRVNVISSGLILPVTQQHSAASRRSASSD